MRIAAIVLAAGRSSRMAPRNKLLEVVAGRRVIARVAGAAIEGGASPVIVVTGFEASGIAKALHGLDVVLVHNPAFDDGLSTSLHAGLRAAPTDSDGALILLGDMPEIAVADLKALMASFTTAKDRKAICVPARGGGRGNPVLWGAAHFAEMMEIGGDVGAKQLLVRHPQHVIEVTIESDGIFADVDTAADLVRLRSNFEPEP